MNFNQLKFHVTKLLFVIILLLFFISPLINYIKTQENKYTLSEQLHSHTLGMESFLDALPTGTKLNVDKNVNYRITFMHHVQKLFFYYSCITMNFLCFCHLIQSYYTQKRMKIIFIAIMTTVMKSMYHLPNKRSNFTDLPNRTGFTRSPTREQLQEVSSFIIYHKMSTLSLKVIKFCKSKNNN